MNEGFKAKLGRIELPTFPHKLPKSFRFSVQQNGIRMKSAFLGGQ